MEVAGRQLESPQGHPGVRFSLQDSSMNLRQTLISLALLTFIHGAQAQQLGDPDCTTLWLVSSYSTNAIKVFDGCSGEFIEDIDDNGWLAGPQAIVEDGQGGLIVVSEENDRLIRFDRRTLAIDRVVAGDDPATPEFEAGPVDAPTGLVISPAGRWFLGSFSQNRVAEINPANGGYIETIVASGQGIEGADAGMWLQGNQLYVPGFDSSTIVRADIDKVTPPQTLVAAGSNGINAPRTIIVDDQGDLLVSSWRGNQILAFDRNSGAFKRVVASVQRPTGMALEAPGVLLVTSDQFNDVKRVRISDGAILGTPVSSGSGALRGGTWIMVIEKLDAPEASLAGESNALFLVGVGAIDGTAISANPMIHTTGGLWGSELDPAAIEEHEWGAVLLEFSGCNEGEMSFTADHPQFGDGGYPIVRLANSPLGDACEAAGFENVTDNNWMSGHWYGGAARAGEGFSIDVINDEQAIVTWYTYLPSTQDS